MRTPRFELTVGLTPGYFHSNQQAFVYKDGYFAELWMKHAEEEYVDSDIYVPANVILQRFAYRKQWGCPEYGEVTLLFYGLLNPKFTPAYYSQNPTNLWWTNAVTRVCEALRKELKQTTAYLSFTEVDFIYLKDEQ